MSYILDALKKAERERGLSQVPTLSTVHELREKRPIRLWAASGLVVLCIAVLALLYVPGLGTRDEAKPSMAEEADSVPIRAEPEPLKALVSADAAPVSVLSETPPATAALSDEAGIEMTAIGRQEPAEGERQDIQSDLLAAANRPAAVPSSDETIAESPPQELIEIPAPKDQMEIPVVEEPAPMPIAAVEGAISLRDALEEMTMSILLYSENEAERLVFINGRKYVEGDMVEGNYLLESIAPDGAVLSYGGERAVLRPDRN
jgi:general secretion pathway protein B